LPPKDLIPLLSFLWLRRRCRYCGALIRSRVFLVEVATALLFAFLYWHYGLTAQLGITAFYSCVFLVLLVIDLERQLILNKIVYPAAVVALLIGVFVLQTEAVAHAPKLFLSQPAIVTRTLVGVTGGATGFILLLIPALLFRGGMGWGDVKMAGLIGLVVGFPLVFVAILGAMVAGGVVGGALLLFRIKDRKDPIPYGPFLSLATMATLFYGNEILDWYLGLFQ